MSRSTAKEPLDQGVGEDTTGYITPGDIKDSIDVIYNDAGVWQDFSSVAWTTDTHSPDPTLGNGTITARYAQIENTVHYRVTLVAGSTTAAGSGRWQFSLPVTALGMSTATVMAKDSSAVVYYWGVAQTAGDLCQIYMHTSSAALGASVAGYPFTLASGDWWGFSLTYEADPS